MTDAVPMTPEHPLHVTRIDVRIHVERTNKPVTGFVPGDQSIDLVQRRRNFR